MGDRYVECFIIDGVIDEDVLFLVYCQEVAAMAVFYYLAIWYLDLL